MLKQKINTSFKFLICRQRNLAFITEEYINVPGRETWFIFKF